MSQEKMRQRKIIQKAKKLLKKEEAFLEKCKEYDKDPDFIDDVKISFAPLDVSAKTVNEEILLNDKLFGGKMKEIVKYICHESIHCLQQDAGEVSEKTDKSKYLDDENEISAFNSQLEFMSDHYTPEEIQDYLENLLDHHNIKGKERREKIKELTKED